MFNVCYRCGEYHPEKTIDPAGPYAICPECGHRHPFHMLPLLLVGGASGSGKTVALRRLTGRREDVVLLESDILWRPEFNTPDDNYRDFFETWLRVAKNIGQSGRPVVVFGAGFAVPHNIEPCVERRYFSTVNYLALVCDDAALERRLKARPAWRESGDESFIAAQQQFNQWLRDYDDDPPLSRLNTTDSMVEATAAAVGRWIDAILAADCTRRALGEANEAYAALRNDSGAWSEVEDERQDWDATLGDGLDAD